MNAALRVEELRKSYGGRPAVDGVCFECRPGEILGLLGPNGAGKTTTLESVEGLRRPDSGRVEICGLDPWRDGSRLREVLGVQLQLSALPGPMTPAEAMRVFARYHGIEPRLNLLSRFGLEASAAVAYRDLSVGQQRRLALALAIAHRPEVVLLDEPTAGLDVAARAQLHAAMRELRAEGVALVLATHDMAEAEALADRVAIVLRGRVAVTGTPREITAAGPALTRVSIATARGSVKASDAPALPGVERGLEEDGAAVFLSRDAGATVAAMVERVRAAGDTLSDLRVERPSLEERFLEITGAPAEARHARSSP